MGYETAFSPDYASARRRFRAGAERAGARMERVAVAGEGPGGEDLTIDAAILGASHPERLVILSGGLHGVEGFLGSAIQCALLEDPAWSRTLPGNTAVLLIHALNPYGYAWLRRFDAGNIDLNRNFLPNGTPFAGCPPLYRALDPWLNARRPPEHPAWSLPWALGQITLHGMARLKQAIAEGQYDYPKGLFFGGHGPSPTRRALAEHLPRWAGQAQQVLHLDIHTGLGSFATFKLLVEPARAGRGPWLAQVFGADAVQFSEPGGIAYQVHGDFLNWCGSEPFAGRRYDGLCAEFGTYPPLHVLLALRGENQAHHWSLPDGPATRRAKARLLEAFAPASARWRHSCVASGLDLARRALLASPDA